MEKQIMKPERVTLQGLGFQNPTRLTSAVAQSNGVIQPLKIEGGEKKGTAKKAIKKIAPVSLPERLMSFEGRSFARA